MEIHETSHEEKCTENQKPTRENEHTDAEEEEEEKEEEETLSLCDLPVDDNQTRHRDDQSPACSRTEEDFDFGSWSHSVPREPEMCAADDVFFKGQILPLRFSVSSGDGCPGSQPEFRRSISRSESMDHASISRLTSLHSSRSSSTRSYHSSSTSSCSATNSNPTLIRNNFHTHPSPKPQIRPSKTWPGSRNPNPRTQKSTLWDFLKLGLIRAPEIELQDLKARNSFSNNRISVSRNSSWSSNSSGGGGGGGSIKNHHNQEQKQGNNFVQAKRSTVGLFGGCKCSVDAIQTAVLSDAVLMKSCKRSENMDDVEEKVMMLKKDEKGNEKEKMKRRGKQGLSRRRTSDWLRDLSHVTYGDD